MSNNLGIYKSPTRNIFCPTGEGGGVDPTCSPTSGMSPQQDSPASWSSDHKEVRAAAADMSGAEVNKHQFRSLRNYGFGDYDDVNRYLRTRAIPNEPNRVTKIIEDLDNVMERSVTKAPLTVYRLVPPEVLSGMMPGQSFVDKGFVSTSRLSSPRLEGLDSRLATSSVKMAIATPRGFNAIDMDRGGYSFADEREVLLPRGVKFTLDRIEAGVYYMTPSQNNSENL